MPRLSDDLDAELRKLKSVFGLEVVRELYAPDDFGNGLVELQGEGLRMRIIRDRSQLFVDLAEPEGPWTNARDCLSSFFQSQDDWTVTNFARISNLFCSNPEAVRTATSQR
jgi:hypothetical protein